jgi:hypothetical protein
MFTISLLEVESSPNLAIPTLFSIVHHYCFAGRFQFRGKHPNVDYNLATYAVSHSLGRGV